MTGESKYPEKARALVRGPLWLLPPGPDQVQNLAPPKPFRDTINGSEYIRPSAANHAQQALPTKCAQASQGLPQVGLALPRLFHGSYAVKTATKANRQPAAA